MLRNELVRSIICCVGVFAVATVLLAGSVWAEHPLLSESTSASRWHALAGSDEAVYVPGEEGGDPRLVLRREAVADASLTLNIETDARALIIGDGEGAFEVPLPRADGHRLVLDGREARPTVRLNDRELAALRGPWIRLFLRNEAADLPITFTNAGYVNVRFSGQRQPIRGGAPAEADTANGTEGAGVGAAAADGDGARGTGQAAGAPVTVVPADPRARRAIPGDHTDLIDPVNPWRLDFSLGVDYLTAYFYRGIARENQDLILQPWADASLRVFTAQERELKMIDYVDLRVGLRSTHVWHEDSIMRAGTAERWTELMWSGGVAMGFLDRFEAGVYYENIESIHTVFRDVHQFNFELKFDDSDPNYDWSFQPYALLSFEYENQSDYGWLSQAVGQGDLTSHGVYLELGVRPEFALFHLHLEDPVTLAVPARVGLSLSDYYEDSDGRDSTFGYASVGLDFTVPLASFPAEGNRRFLWNLHGGVEFLFLGSSARDLSEVFGAGGRTFQPIGRFGVSLDF